MSERADLVTEAGKAGKINVLLVDDEEPFLASVSRVLVRRGFTVFTAASGDEARQIFRTTPIDVAVLDVRLSDVDGHDLFYEIKNVLVETEVIMLTGHGDLHEAFEMGSLGAFDYLAKPCNLDLLASRIQEAAAGRGSGVAGASSQKVKVLLVDDEVDFLTSTKRILARRGFFVQLATDGRKALDLLSERPIDVVILDVRMPGPDGSEVLEQIKRTYPSVAVIMLTGHATVETAAECMKKGAFDYLFKPHSPEDLVDKIMLAATHRQH
jgi:DNA-binding NtrC family response regulator